jgi:hypothetical protein
MPSLTGKSRTLIASAIAVLSTSAAFAAGGPENALVVVNADSWASTFIANEYVAARRIPPSNVVRLRNLPDFERMNVEDFRVKILGPVLQAAEQRGIAPQIDYVLYSADFPWAIDVTADLGGKHVPKVITQPASITGLTYLYQFTMGKNPGYLGLNVNFYYRQQARTQPDPDWSEDDRKLYTETVTAMRRVAAEPAATPGNTVPPPPKLSNSQPAPEEPTLTEILGKLLELRKRHPASTELLYNIACAHARLGDPVAAVGALRDAVDNGWWDMHTADTDPDLATIRGREDYSLVAARARLVKFEIIPTSGFRASVGWLPTGQPVPAAKGVRYMLSTVLACTSGRGNSVADALRSLRRSIEADGSHPKGTIYYMQNRDVRSTTREWGFRRAVEKLREAGVSAEIVDGVLPRNKSDVAGATIGSADFVWEGSGSKFLPGAIGDNLTSYGGALAEGDGQTAITEFIRHGAAGAGGTVTEPFAIQAKFPAPFIHYHYALGCSLAEAFYQSLAAPYQLLIVGDALCAPWKKELSVLPGELERGMILKGMLRLTPAIHPGDITAGAFELCLDGRRVAAATAGKPIEINTAEAADGSHELALIATGNDAAISRGGIRIPVIIRNGENTLRVAASAETIPWDRALELKASAPGATSIAFYHDVDEVARIEGSTGSAKFDPRILGQGTVRIQPVAHLPDGKTVLGEPLAIRVTPPAFLQPLSSYSRQVYAGGFTVKGVGKSAIVQKATDDWLKGAGIATGEAFTIEGWFTVPAADTYQFQLRGAACLRLTVDGKPQDWPRGSEWWFVPVPLGAGRHVVRIEGTATTERLDIRFGGPGSRRLDGTRFQHVTAN